MSPCHVTCVHRVENSTLLCDLLTLNALKRLWTLDFKTATFSVYDFKIKKSELSHPLPQPPRCWATAPASRPGHPPHTQVAALFCRRPDAPGHTAGRCWGPGHRPRTPGGPAGGACSLLPEEPRGSEGGLPQKQGGRPTRVLPSSGHPCGWSPWQGSPRPRWGRGCGLTPRPSGRRLSAGTRRL